MVSVSELWKTWQEGFANKDSSKLAEFLTDDFQFIRPAGGARTRQETLDWTAAGGSPTSIDDLELLYENDDVAVIVHGANTISPVTGEQGDGVVMAFYTKKDGKISQCRIVRQAA
jgi:ketosteroid isomerase-like protein